MGIISKEITSLKVLPLRLRLANKGKPDISEGS